MEYHFFPKKYSAAKMIFQYNWLLDILPKELFSLILDFFTCKNELPIPKEYLLLRLTSKTIHSIIATKIEKKYQWDLTKNCSLLNFEISPSQSELWFLTNKKILKPNLSILYHREEDSGGSVKSLILYEYQPSNLSFPLYIAISICYTKENLFKSFQIDILHKSARVKLLNYHSQNLNVICAWNSKAFQMIPFNDFFCNQEKNLINSIILFVKTFAGFENVFENSVSWQSIDQELDFIHWEKSHFLQITRMKDKIPKENYNYHIMDCYIRMNTISENPFAQSSLKFIQITHVDLLKNLKVKFLLKGNTNSKEFVTFTLLKSYQKKGSAETDQYGRKYQMIVQPCKQLLGKNLKTWIAESELS